MFLSSRFTIVAIGTFSFFTVIVTWPVIVGLFRMGASCWIRLLMIVTAASMFGSLSKAASLNFGCHSWTK